MSRWRAFLTGSGTACARHRLLHLIIRASHYGRNLTPLLDRCVIAMVEHATIYKKGQLVAHPVGTMNGFAVSNVFSYDEHERWGTLIDDVLHIVR